MKTFAYDASLCNGCYCCQIACKDEHVDTDWSPIAKPQPDVGHFWLKLNEVVRGTVPKVRVNYLPVLCQHCEKAPCMDACTVESAIYRRDDGLIIIDPARCSGCMDCSDACPYNVIYFNETSNIAQKCTGCAHLLDNGWSEPRCVDACPNGALKFIEETEVREFRNAEHLSPEFKTKPRMYYLNLPGKFIAGTLYDPVIKDVVEGATCILTDAGSGNEIKTQTDGFGDFWFTNLETGNYDLEIKATGFQIKSIAHIKTDKDVNLGDIPLK